MGDWLAPTALLAAQEPAALAAVRSILAGPEAAARATIDRLLEPWVEGYAVRFRSASKNELRSGPATGCRPWHAETAFDQTLAEVRAGRRTVFALWRHDYDHMLASTSCGLVLSVDGDGLRFAFPAGRLSARQRDLVGAGRVGMSISFQPDQSSVSPEGRGLAMVTNAHLTEISVTEKPAHEGTSIRFREPTPGLLLTALCRARTTLLSAEA